MGADVTVAVADGNFTALGAGDGLGSGVLGAQETMRVTNRRKVRM